MKMKGMFKKGLCLSLAVITAVSFTGCGKKSSGDTLVDNVAKSSKDYVFSQKELDIKSDGDDINRVTYIGDRVYASTAGIGGKISIFSFNPDGSDLKTATIPTTDKDSYSYISFDAEGNIYAFDYYSNYVYNEGDGDMVLYETQEPVEAEADAEAEANETDAVSESMEDGAEDTAETPAEGTEETNTEAESDGYIYEGDEPIEECSYLVIFDKDGNLKEKIELDKDYATDGYIGANSLTVTDDGTVLLSLDYGIIRYKQGEGFKTLVDNSKNSNPNYYHFIKGYNDKIYVFFYGDNGRVVCPFDIETGTIGDEYKSLTDKYDYSYFTGAGYDFYMSNDEGIFGFDTASDSLEKILDYLDSDIDSTDPFSSAAGISDTEFIAVMPDDEYNYYLTRYTKVPPEEVKEKKIITLGGYYIDYDIRRQAFKFNKTSSEYKIKFVDYSVYDSEDNYDAGTERLNMDIVSGNTPDILLLSDYMPVDSYINKGLFTDLMSFLEKDPDVSVSDLLPNVVEALKTGDKLYQIIPSFYVSTMMVKSKYTDGKDVLSLKDCQDIIAKTGTSQLTAFGLMSREDFLQQGIRFSGDSYIDWENKQCHFNSDAFINFLEFSKGFYDEIPDNAWDDYKDTLYRTDDSIFEIRGCSELADFQYVEQVTFGTEVSFVGYPNDLGINNSIIIPNTRIAICAQSKNKDAAWEFLRNILSEEYQDNVYNMPVRRSSFDKMAEKTTQKTYSMEDGKKVEYDDIYYIGGEKITIQPFSQEEMQRTKNFVESVTFLNNFNQSVNDIIMEEASAFYSGQKSAKEVADIIQSRLSIYVNENS